jgi:hypothetical protein
MKKRKHKTKQQQPSEPTSIQTTGRNWFFQPLSFTTSHQRSINVFGYILSGFGILLIAGFILQGYMSRPILLDDKVIERILDENVSKSYWIPNQDYSQSNQILLLTDQSKVYLDKAGKPVGFYMTTGQNNHTGIMIPMEYINIPNGIEKISISFGFMYVGEPVISWGFQASANESQVKTVDSEFSNNQDGNFLFTSTASVETKESFSVSWDQAGYFIFIVNSQIETGTLLSNISIMGYYH